MNGMNIGFAHLKMLHLIFFHFTLSLDIMLASASSDAELCCTSLFANILE